MTIIILLSVLIIYNNQSWEKDIFIPLIELQVVENWYLFINNIFEKNIYITWNRKSQLGLDKI